MRRIVSCYSNAYGPFGVHAAVEGLAQIGLRHVELALKPHDFGGLVIPESVLITPNSDEMAIRVFSAILRERDILVSGCNVGGADLCTPVGFEVTAGRIRFASEIFHAPFVVSGAGRPETRADRVVLVDHLKKLGDLAGSLGTTLTLETHAGPTQNADAMLALMADVDHPSVRLNFDTGNIAYYNPGADPVAELERVAPWVGSVHLKDNRGVEGDWYFPALGEGGAVDFRRVRELLDAVGFLGPYTIEIEGIGGEGEPGLEIRQARVARSVEHLGRCGFAD